MQARHCAGHFFDGIHAAGRHAHGVYEGSYWQLLADAEELKAMLTRMAKAPPLMAEPVLVLPPPLELPSWDEFKPVLQPVPDTVHVPELVLPPFVKPPLLVCRSWHQTTLVYLCLCKGSLSMASDVRNWSTKKFIFGCPDLTNKSII